MEDQAAQPPQSDCIFLQRFFGSLLIVQKGTRPEGRNPP